MNSIDYYNKHAKEYFQSTVEANMQEHYDMFLKHLPTNAFILDLGCGSGRDASYFKKNGYRVIAVDGSESLCNLAKRNFNIDVKCLNFEDLDYENLFDGIWACASLLHVSRDKMKQVLMSITRALKPEGVLYASFKFGDSERVDNGRFYCDYDYATIRPAFESDKLEIIRIWDSYDVRSDFNNHWINLLCKKT